MGQAMGAGDWKKDEEPDLDTITQDLYTYTYLSGQRTYKAVLQEDCEPAQFFFSVSDAHFIEWNNITSCGAYFTLQYFAVLWSIVCTVLCGGVIWFKV